MVAALMVVCGLVMAQVNGNVTLNQITMGVGAPPAGGYVSGSVWIDTGSGNVYQANAGGWSGPLMNIIGPAGAAGNTGVNGATGPQGAVGTAGAVGANGATGGIGATGSQGATGSTGAAGANGTNGISGTVYQSAQVVTDTTGFYAWTYPAPYGGGITPQCWGQAIGPSPAAGVLVNVQTEGTPTNLVASFRVNKTNAAVVALLGLTILSVPTSVGATTLTVFCKAP